MISNLGQRIYTGQFSLSLAPTDLHSCPNQPIKSGTLISAYYYAWARKRPTLAMEISAILQEELPARKLNDVICMWNGIGAPHSRRSNIPAIHWVHFSNIVIFISYRIFFK